MCSLYPCHLCFTVTKGFLNKHCFWLLTALVARPDTLVSKPHVKKPLGTIKASQVVVLSENSVVVTQRKLMNSQFNLISLRNIYIKSGLH